MSDSKSQWRVIAGQAMIPPTPYYYRVTGVWKIGDKGEKRTVPWRGSLIPSRKQMNITGIQTRDGSADPRRLTKQQKKTLTKDQQALVHARLMDDQLTINREGLFELLKLLADMPANVKLLADRAREMRREYEEDMKVEAGESIETIEF